MRLLMIGPNYPPEPIGIAVYTGGLAEVLAAGGHDVSVVVGQPHYPGWRVFDGWRRRRPLRTREGEVDVTRVPLYVPGQPSGAKRIVHYLTFALLAGPTLVWRALRQRPHVVIAIAPSLMAAPFAWLAARLTGGKCWLHIQDFEIEAAFATGLVREQGFIASVAARFERRVVTAFDGVSSISQEMCRKLREKGAAAARVYEFRNWADIDRIQPLRAPSDYRAQWGITSKYVALYAGNIARKQGIDIVAQAARALRHRTDITFVICGNGPERSALEYACADLANVQIHDLQPSERLGELLGCADIHLLPQMANAADLVLPSKLTNMLASGRPVVTTAAPGTGLWREVEDCGISCPPGDVQAFAVAIETLVDDRDLYNRSAAFARRRAIEAWEKSGIIGGFVKRLTMLVGGEALAAS